ncbi:MAG TPA: EB domain-containing protein [Sandaracinaceae bacterium LLY-WYZ-13_1]|nr:EB domain-containing protein [Sandaracinaceae bacterium LLY-WYZ-13_1]
MSTRGTIETWMLGIAVIAAATVLAPRVAEAQYGCTTPAQCPQGSTCVNGTCVQQQQGYQQQPPPGYQQQGYPQQQGYQQQSYQQQQPRTETRRMIGLIVAGAVALAAGWAANILVSAFAGVGSSTVDDWDAFRGYSFIPVVGPWVQLATKPTGFSADSWAGWLVADGIVQAAGLAMLIVGIAVPVETTVYSEGGPGDGLDLALLPQVGPGHGGLSLVGRF